MIAAVRYRKGLGNSALFLRLRVFERLFNFVTRGWQTNDTAETRLWMSEYPDDGQQRALYAVDLDYPQVEDLIEEAVWIDTLDVVGWEVVRFDVTYSEITGSTFDSRPARAEFSASPVQTRFYGAQTTELTIKNKSSNIRIEGTKSKPRLSDD